MRVEGSELSAKEGTSPDYRTPDCLELLRRRPVEDEIERLRFLRADCDGLVLCAEFFLPSFDDVGAGREIFQREVTGFRRDVEIGVREDEKVRAHPRMDVTRDARPRVGWG